jgi:hypothetical protein
MNVYQRLNAARKKFHALKLSKSGENKFAGYKYFELGDFLIPGMEVMAEHGLCATVSFPDKAVMTIRNVEKPDEVIVFESPMGSAALKGCHEVQNIGAVETYQRRYLWVAALEIVEHDALDATTGRDEEPRRKENGRLPGVGVHKPTDGMLDSLPEDMQLDIRLVASVLPGIFEKQGIEAAFDKIESKQYENDEKVALWGLLDSKIRSALKREGEKRHIAARNPAIEAGLPAH